MAENLGAGLLWLVLLVPWITLATALLHPAVLHSRALLGLPPFLALVIALSDQDIVLELPGLLLGSSFGVNVANRVFLAITAVAWLAAIAVSAMVSRRPRFAFCFLLAMASNLAVVSSLDALSFFAAFAVMGLSVYGLIVEKGDASAHFAGHFYIVFAVIAELALLAGLIAFANAAVSLRLPLEFHTQPSTWALVCVLAGFGVKAGMVPLHMTLPLAYAAAPAPGGIALAGAMLNAGILGWLLWLPLGQFSLPQLGSTLMILGVSGIVLGVGVGLLQRDPRALLAYSSISQVALVILGIGAGLGQPAVWPVMLPVLALFVLHHALIKTAAFCLSSGVNMSSAWVRSMALLPVLALAGVPWTLGHASKLGIKDVLSGVAGNGFLAGFGLSLASLGTALLMMRWWTVLKNDSCPGTSGRAALVSASLILLGYVLVSGWESGAIEAIGLADSLNSLWPTLAGAALGAIVLYLKPSRLNTLAGAITNGDIARPVSKLAISVLALVAAGGAVVTNSYHIARTRIQGLRPPAPGVSGNQETDTTLPAFLLVVTLLLMLYLLDLI